MTRDIGLVDASEVDGETRASDEAKAELLKTRTELLEAKEALQAVKAQTKDLTEFQQSLEKLKVQIKDNTKNFWIFVAIAS